MVVFNMINSMNITNNNDVVETVRDNEQTSAAFDTPLLVCCNCHRCDQNALVDEQLVSAYSVDIRSYRITSLSIFRMAFCNMRSAQFVIEDDRVLDISLCRLCRMYFAARGATETVGVEVVWPAMIWKWLTTPELVKARGRSLWGLVPEVWRPWWIVEARKCHSVMATVTLEDPASIFVDVTLPKMELEHAIDELQLVNMKKAVDKHLYPVVKCPFGCSEYYHKTGNLPFDIIVAHLFGIDRVATKSSKTLLRKVKGIRTDFLDAVGSSEEFAWNPDWAVVPSVAFVKGSGGVVPVFLSCRDHDGGCQQQYLHPPRAAWNTLPSDAGDQLAPAVIVPRTIKPLRPGKYSHTSRMHNVRGFFGGVDSISITDAGRFENMSSIARWNESVTIQARGDIKAMLSSMKEERRQIPAWLGEAMLETAQEDVPSADSLLTRWQGATFVTLGDAIKLQVAARTDGFDTARFVTEQGLTKTVQFRGQWPRKLVWLHNFDLHGAAFASVPSIRLKDADCRLLWLLLTMHVTVPSLWESTVESLNFVEDWHGWILTFVSTMCFEGQRMRGQNSPFRLNAFRTQADKERKLAEVIGLLFASGRRVEEPMRSDDDWEHVDTQQHVGRDNETNPIRSGWVNIRETVSVVGNNDENEAGVDGLPTYAGPIPLNMPGVGDGCFHAEHLKQIFSLQKCISCMEDEFRSDCVRGEETIAVVIGSMPEVRERLLAPKLSDTDDRGNVWELRFLGMGSVGSGRKWNAISYARHGGRRFPGWWRVERSLKSAACWTKVDGPVPERLEQPWHVAMYIRCGTEVKTELRDAFLTSLNGQTRAFCSLHDLPLIVAPYKNKGTCLVKDDATGNACKKEPYYQCTKDGCTVQLCKDHFICACRTEGSRFNVVPRPESSDSTEADTVIVDVEEGIFEERQGSLFNNSGHDSMSNGMEENGIVEIDENEFLADTQLDMCVPEDASVADIPTTNSASHSLRVSSGKRTFVGGHVILNNCGTLLVRKRSKLNGTRQQQNFLQRMATSCPGRSIPLVYPEGMLFPLLFWKDDGFGELVLGAIPAALLTRDSFLHQYGFASVAAHMRCRLTNPGFSGSTDFRYICYAFDSVTNLGCRGQDTRVILSRGMELGNKGHGVRAKGKDEPLFDTDSIDSRPVVNRLAAAVAEKQATYFYTHTCNQAEQFGIRRIKQWIDSDEILDHLCRDPGSFLERAEVRRAVLSGSSVALCRNWMEVSELWMTYILSSTEAPLGNVVRMWWRHEYQDTTGNLSHIHALLWIADEPQQHTHERIRGSLMTLVRPDELDSFIDEGLIENVGEWNSIREKAERVLKHVCNNRCMKRVGVGKDDLKCRVANNEIESPNPREHAVKEIEVQHSENSMAVMERLNLYVRHDTTGRFVPTTDLLRVTKHYPPAYSAEGIISPCCGRLFLASPSNQNVKIATGYLSSRYLAKYVAGIDEHNRIYVGAMSSDPNGVELDYQFLHNTKVTGSAVQEAKRLETRRDKRHPTGRAISEMEMIAILLGYEQVHTNIKFVQIPTVPMEERPAVDRAVPLLLNLTDQSSPESFVRMTTPSDLDSNSVIPSYSVRRSNKRMSAWRQLSDSETLILRDQLLSPLSIDATTVFGIRPPELRFVKRQALYFRWFCREPLIRGHISNAEMRERLAHLLHHDIEKCWWIDGTNHKITVRPDALAEVLSYLRNSRTDADFYSTDQLLQGIPNNAESPLYKITRLFRTLLFRMSDAPSSRRLTEEWTAMKERFICTNSKGRSLPVTWYNSVRPTQPNRFLYHVLLSMGEFDNELNLFAGTSIKECFVRARLVDERPDFIEQSIDDLTRRYVLEQLVFLPGGSQQFDRFLVAAHGTLRQAILHDTLPVEDLPPVLYTHLRMQTTKEAVAHIEMAREVLLTTVLRNLSDSGFHHLPLFDDISQASSENPFQWTAARCNVCAANQSRQSFDEQTAVIDIVSNRFRSYQLAETRLAKSICIVGGPGVGKSTLLQLLAVDAASRGLAVAMTALMSERSRELGGHHLNQMFAIPVNERAPVPRLAELALINLYRQPKRMAFLQRIDVLFIDELGQVSAEMLAVLDVIMRRVRDNSIFMGGLLLVCTMDALQLRPVTGRPALLSPHMLTCFTLHELHHSVRASRDPVLREIQSYTRKHPAELTESDIRRFRQLIEQNCTFVPTWDDPRLSPNMLRVFGKKAAAREAERRLLVQARAIYCHMLLRQAVDEESTAEGNWIPATDRTSSTLSRKIKEPSVLYFFPNAHYEITFNDRDGRFSQSQLAILLDMPSDQQLRNFEPVKLLVAPEGCKSVPFNFVSKQDFLDGGWREIGIGTSYERSESLGMGVLGKRCQYGLKHRMCCTIHSAMGQNLTELVTRVTLTTDSQYFLWEREQVVVLLSRTFFAKRIYFVGDPKETSAALAQLLCKQSQYSEYIHHLLRQLAGRSQHRAIPLVDLSLHPLRQADIELPQDSSGYVYILLSIKDKCTTYIGQTQNLVTRLKQHNSGYGSVQTANPALRPWALLAFVSGFDGNVTKRLAFETAWERRRDQAILRRGRLPPEDIAQLAVSLLEATDTANLRFVMCSFPSRVAVSTM